MNNKALITRFYEAFASADAEGMAECYHDQIRFHDPAFGTLMGDDAGNMWRMLIERTDGNIKVNFNNVEANERTGSANWQAEYLYGPKQRKVINHIAAEFEFSEGKIIRHTDDFNLWKWTRQALGLPGHLLGWSSFMRRKIQKQTNELLKTYSSKNA